jgi:hypothetical protein
VNGSSITPSFEQKFGFVISIISWIFYTISGFYVFTNHDLSYLFLGFAFLSFSIWILYKWDFNENRGWYLICNAFYTIILALLYFNVFFGLLLTEYIHLTMLIAILIFIDYPRCNSMDKCYN